MSDPIEKNCTCAQPGGKHHVFAWIHKCGAHGWIGMFDSDDLSWLLEKYPREWEAILAAARAAGVSLVRASTPTAPGLPTYAETRAELPVCDHDGRRMDAFEYFPLTQVAAFRCATCGALQIESIECESTEIAASGGRTPPKHEPTQDLSRRVTADGTIGMRRGVS